MYMDTSLQLLGAMRMQGKQVIAYASCMFHPHEHNYPTYDLELAAVMFALKKWSHYLFGERCEVYTEYKGLKYFFHLKGSELEVVKMDKIIK